MWEKGKGEEMKLRDWIKSNGGGFSKALLKALETDSLDDLLYAYALADARNQKSLNEAFPGLEEVYQNSLRWDSIGRGVRVAFPSFTQLHEEIGEPWKVALFPHE
jgi:hypothetical protein